MLTQTEQRRKLTSELQSLTKKRLGLEAWARQAWSELSPEAVEKKLMEVRTTPQLDPMLKIIHDVYKDEKLKQDAIDRNRQELNNNMPRLKQHVTALEELKKLKVNKNLEVSVPP